MSVRVIARVRPLLKSERELDVIIRTGNSSSELAKVKKGSPDGKTSAVLKDRETAVRIPNPKNEGEQYTFQFNAVYGGNATQQEIFDAEGQSENSLQILEHPALIVTYSRSYRETPVQWIRCHNLCLRSHWNRQDPYNAGW